MAAITDPMTGGPFAIMVSDGSSKRAYGIGMAGKRWAAEANLRGARVPDGMAIGDFVAPSPALAMEFASAFGCEPSASACCRSRVAAQRAKMLSSSTPTERQTEVVYGGRSASWVGSGRRMPSSRRMAFPGLAVAQAKMVGEAYVKSAVLGGGPTW